MREIKFRAFIKELGTVHNVLELFFCEGTSTFVEGYDFPLDVDDVELMQYTGIKDGEGTDIYEGDIVTCSYNGLCTLSGYHEVRYTAEYGFSPIQEPVDYGERYAETNDWLVVGNIYENPDLELK